MGRSKRRSARRKVYRRLDWNELADIAGLDVRQKIQIRRYMIKKKYRDWR